MEKLYKLTSKGQIQEWTIWTVGNVIKTKYGLQGGKLQETDKVILKGKNIGRSNETTPEQQAEAEALATWTKKLAKDYFISVECARNQTQRLAKDGGYLPMLAQDYKKHAERHFKYPGIVQRKLDGIRCIATKADGMVDLWFRSGKRLLTLPLINEQLKHVMKDNEIFDGELYIHGAEFNQFTGAIRRNKSLDTSITDRIELHIYDVPRIYHGTSFLKEDVGFERRFNALRERFTKFNYKPNLVLVDTQIVQTFEQAMERYEQYIDDGYEGIMFRNIDMPYEQKRSYNLLKYKIFMDAEFKIIDVVIDDSRTRYVDDSLIVITEYKVICVTEDGVIVDARMMGSQDVLAEMFKHPEQLIGKYATIKFFGYTPEGSLRFPVAVTVRFDK